MEDALALELLRALADVGDQLAPGDVRVVREGLLTEWDFLQHAAAYSHAERSETLPYLTGGVVAEPA